QTLRLLCIGIGAIFAVDVFVYSQTLMLERELPLFRELRGFANAALGPVVVLGVKRQAEWERELFVSRHVAFYTASLLVVGAYLIGMGLIAYLIRATGGEWGWILQAVFLVVAFALLVPVLFSATLRARSKALLVK